MGLTFKENVPDLRNSRSADIVAGSTSSAMRSRDRPHRRPRPKPRANIGRTPIALDGAAYDLVVGAVEA
jgi:UDP-N-acetyl-D-mannosaminuronate dehydrogenase